VDGHAAPGTPLCELEAKTALADARLAHDTEEPPFPGRDTFERALEHRHLFIAANERR
jgi:hypothetical protein